MSSVITKVTELFAQDKLAKLTLNELKAFLGSHKLPVSGKKAELIARVQGVLSRPV